ncbi:MAG: putative secreted protein [Candidatus Phytoplasma cynodontis]|uniref:hypothetical protein n=1 Tax='Cynodon dactylon' phytoplasma TaxID=295320 RepID=UPI001265BCA9|nr:hypothetical protein ['Cynodon dactylon' phytoplasma]KAB8122106.1 hypothetical protein F1741_01040 ['Cynodon dactylon' phytoplasma]WIA07885.1 MAG: putative secreted protein [Candidatus Phytoplasma cynodontis]
METKTAKQGYNFKKKFKIFFVFLFFCFFVLVKTNFCVFASLSSDDYDVQEVVLENIVQNQDPNQKYDTILIEKVQSYLDEIEQVKKDLFKFLKENVDTKTDISNKKSFDFILDKINEILKNTTQENIKDSYSKLQYTVSNMCSKNLDLYSEFAAIDTPDLTEFLSIRKIKFIATHFFSIVQNINDLLDLGDIFNQTYNSIDKIYQFIGSDNISLFKQKLSLLQGWKQTDLAKIEGNLNKIKTEYDEVLESYSHSTNNNNDNSYNPEDESSNSSQYRSLNENEKEYENFILIFIIFIFVIFIFILLFIFSIFARNKKHRSYKNKFDKK